MRAFKQKIAGRKGASVLYALLFLLAASMVAVLVLEAALTMVRRVRDDEARQQDYLTANSAARLFADCLGRTSCYIDVSVTTVQTTDNAPFDEPAVTTYRSSGPLETLLLEAFETAAGGGEYTSDSALTIRAGKFHGAEVMEDVLVSFTMQPDRYEDTDEHAADNFKINAVFTAGQQKLYLTAYRAGGGTAVPQPAVTDDSRLSEGIRRITKTEISTVVWDRITLSTNGG